jgi:hypothetical protein
MGSATYGQKTPSHGAIEVEGMSGGGTGPADVFNAEPAETAEGVGSPRRWLVIC